MDTITDVIMDVVGIAVKFWPVLILLVTWLFSMSRRSQPESADRRMPDFGGRTEPRPTSAPVRPLETDRGEARDGSAQLDSDTGTTAARHMTRRGAAATERLSRLSTPASPGRERAHAQTTQSRTRAEVYAASDRSLLNPKEIRKGIVWSEMIGPARAKRPYGRRL